MKTSIILLLIILCGTAKIFAQFESLGSVPSDSIFNLGDHQFKHKGFTFNSPRALEKALNLNQGSALYESARQYTRTRRWMYISEFIGLVSVGAMLNDPGDSEGYINPVPLLICLTSVGTGLLFWKKSNRQFNKFVDDYNHAVYDNYIQDRFMKPQQIPSSQINVGFKIKF
jgi:hypothetical protein